METSPLAQPAAWANTRYTKDLPDPPPSSVRNTQAVLVLSVNRDSLVSSRPPPPPKDTAAKKTSSTMAAAKLSESPLPPLPGLTRMNSPPVVIRRKPVGNGAVGNKAQSPPHPQPTQAGNVSPVESLSSIFSAYGTEDSSATRHSEDTTATAYSVMEPSPPNPKVLPKDTLGGASTKLDLVSPLYLPTPVSSEIKSNAPHPQHGAAPETHRDGRPPTPPTKEIHWPVTPKSSKALVSVPSEQAKISSPMASQSPSQPQLWRRRSLKSDKPLAVPQLKLTSSHGSTAASAQEAGALLQDIPSLPKPRLPFAGSALDSPILKGFQSFPGRNIRPSPSNKTLPRNPRPEIMEIPKSREDQDGFSQYAQEVEDGYKASSSSTAPNLSPHTQRPPTPEYGHDESPIHGSFPSMRSPASPASPVSPVSPVTPPTEGRPLSIIPEDIIRAVAAPAPAALPPAGPLPSLPPRSSSRASGPRLGLPRSPAPPGRSSPGASPPSANSPAVTPPAVVSPADASSKATATSSEPPASVAKVAALLSHGHVKPPGSNPIPSIAISDDGDASTTKAAPSFHAQPDHESAKEKQQQLAPSSKTGPVDAVVPTSPGEADYLPAAEYSRLFFPGDIIPAPPIKASQLDCLTAHSRFVASKNEHHPVACMTCKVEDNGVRFSCSHCRVRICGGCREALVSNGRDLAKIISSK
ncbi:hypothetical protein DHEL01_v203448 [Diaporthe helianthi]|uniref:Uncharacterized protein n=1 Tax=Diaporthe helianthi TaxID=158607 RepID=A0A2P5I6K1_DIAHE|nr:hypothetical protein DHEL01_v203448 [Diaporthe helianthi]